MQMELLEQIYCGELFASPGEQLIELGWPSSEESLEEFSWERIFLDFFPELNKISFLYLGILEVVGRLAGSVVSAACSAAWVDSSTPLSASPSAIIITLLLCYSVTIVNNKPEWQNAY